MFHPGKHIVRFRKIVVELNGDLSLPAGILEGRSIPRINLGESAVGGSESVVEFNRLF